MKNSYLKDKEVILASASPRRQELMQFLCDDFTVFPSTAEEIIPEDVQKSFSDKAFETAVYLAQLKCRDVAAQNPQAVVIGCDTVVAIDEEILGKPKDASDAERMLRLLSGREHRVISGVCIIAEGREISFGEQTTVAFLPLTEEQIAGYIASGEPDDNAGAYAVQGQGCLFVKGINGDFFNVVGFPVSAINRNLCEYFSSKVR